MPAFLADGCSGFFCGTAVCRQFELAPRASISSAVHGLVRPAPVRRTDVFDAGAIPLRSFSRTHNWLSFPVASIIVRIHTACDAWRGTITP